MLGPHILSTAAISETVGVYIGEVEVRAFCGDGRINIANWEKPGVSIIGNGFGCCGDLKPTNHNRIRTDKPGFWDGNDPNLKLDDTDRQDALSAWSCCKSDCPPDGGDFGCASTFFASCSPGPPPTCSDK